jgi:XisH protein
MKINSEREGLVHLQALIEVEHMPALDSCHQPIVNALNKEGWEITNQSYFIVFEDFSAIPDIRAQKVNGKTHQVIIIEVKCFADQRSEQDELYRAVGQYVFYRNALRLRPIQSKLYMAIPLIVYNRLFSTDIVIAIVNDVRINILVVDTDRQEIVQWLG